MHNPCFDWREIQIYPLAKKGTQLETKTCNADNENISPQQMLKRPSKSMGSNLIDTKGSKERQLNRIQH